MAKKFSKVEAQYENDEKYVQPLSKDNLTDELFDALEPDVVSDDTLSIFEIVPDHTQPRRILPEDIRWKWNGKPTEYGDVLEVWEKKVLEVTDGKFPTKELLRGKASHYVSDDPLVIEFGKIVSLAASIRDVGLNHAIGVVKRGALYRIVYGERRWTAFQLLQHYLGDTTDDYRSMPVKIAAVGDWALAKAQAAENFQADPLNAISKARQFAKLLIIARTDGGERYDTWNALVVNCDRPWYAQVANGDLHPIPYGMGPQFEQALGISTGQMRQYRNLLRLTDDSKVNDAIWMLGDKGNWAEGFMRDIGKYLDADAITQILNEIPGRSVTTVTVLETEEILREAVEIAKKAAEKKKFFTPQTPPQSIGVGEQSPSEPVDKSLWASYQWVGKEALAGGVKVFVTNCTAPETVMVQYPQADGTVKEVPLNIFALEAIPAPTRGNDNADNQKPDTNAGPVDKFGLPLMKGQTVKTRTGHTAQVVAVQGRMIALESEQNKYLQRLHYPETLEIVQPDSNGHALAVGDMVMTDDGRGVGMIVEFVSGNVAKVETSMGVWAYGVPRLKKVEQKPNTLLAPPSPAKPAEQPDLEKSAYPVPGKTSASQLIGKPMQYQGQPTIVIADAGNDEMLIQLGKERVVVAIGELTFHPEYDDDDDDATDHVNGTRQGLVLVEDDVLRLYLEPYRMLSTVLKNEHATAAIEWLTRLTYERTNRMQLEAAMNHVIDHIEDINNKVEEIVFEQFRLKLEELN